MKALERLRKNWFSVLAALLILFLVVNLFGGFKKLNIWWSYRKNNSSVVNVEDWRHWLVQNQDLFQSLKAGAQIGVTKELHHDYGVVWTKQQDGMEVTRTSELRRTGPGLILEFDEEVAKDLQWKKNRDEAIIFLRHRSQIGKIQTYFLKKEEKLEAEGFLEFLREIGLRPSS